MRTGNREDKPCLAQFGEPDLKATTADRQASCRALRLLDR